MCWQRRSPNIPTRTTNHAAVGARESDGQKSQRRQGCCGTCAGCRTLMDSSACFRGCSLPPRLPTAATRATSTAGGGGGSAGSRVQTDLYACTGLQFVVSVYSRCEACRLRSPATAPNPSCRAAVPACRVRQCSRPAAVAITAASKHGPLRRAGAAGGRCARLPAQPLVNGGHAVIRLAEQANQSEAMAGLAPLPATGRSRRPEDLLLLHVGLLLRYVVCLWTAAQHTVADLRCCRSCGSPGLNAARRAMPPSPSA